MLLTDLAKIIKSATSIVMIMQNILCNCLTKIVLTRFWIIFIIDFIILKEKTNERRANRV
jgi:hypothetical protein